MVEAPRWLKDKIKNLLCPFCEKPMVAEAISGYGTKNSVDNKNVSVLFIEYQCPKCNKKPIIELEPMEMEQIVDNLIAEWSNEEDVEEKPVKKNSNVWDGNKPKVQEKSKITDEEIKEVHNILEDSKTWYDVMIRMGINEKQVQMFEEDGIKIDINNKNMGDKAGT